jgi:hypothetical protein
MDITQSIGAFVEDTNTIIHDYNVMKEELNSENKKLKEVCVSYDNIARYMSNIDLSEISLQIEEMKHAVSELSSKTVDSEDILKQKKKDCYGYMKTLHNLYQALDHQNEYTGNEDADPFFVEMNKLLYPNNYDNHQIRDDPPIAGVFKSTNGLYSNTSNTSNDIDSSILPTSDVFNCVHHNHART